MIMQVRACAAFIFFTLWQADARRLHEMELTTLTLKELHGSTGDASSEKSRQLQPAGRLAWTGAQLKACTEYACRKGYEALQSGLNAAQVTWGKLHAAATEDGAWQGENKWGTPLKLGGIITDWILTAPGEGEVATWLDSPCEDIPDPAGYITVGLSYNRKATIKKAIEKKSWLMRKIAGALGRALRSSLLSKKIGTRYEDINGQLIQEGPGQLNDGLNANFINSFHSRSLHDPVIKRVPKRGQILMEFKICGPSNMVRFMQCQVVGDAPSFGKGTYGEFLAGMGWDFLEGVPGFGYILNPQIMKKVVDMFPGQIMTGIGSKIGEPNVRVWPRPIDDGDENHEQLFAELAVSAQAQAEDPPVWPENGNCNPPVHPDAI